MGCERGIHVCFESALVPFAFSSDCFTARRRGRARHVERDGASDRTSSGTAPNDGRLRRVVSVLLRGHQRRRRGVSLLGRHRHRAFTAACPDSPRGRDHDGDRDREEGKNVGRAGVGCAVDAAARVEDQRRAEREADGAPPQSELRRLRELPGRLRRIHGDRRRAARRDHSAERTRLGSGLGRLPVEHERDGHVHRATPGPGLRTARARRDDRRARHRAPEKPRRSTRPGSRPIRTPPRTST
jgi:hypothetical protein